MLDFLQNNHNLFMYLYMNELVSKLNKNKNLLKEITFHKDEANIDSELKLFIKSFIINNHQSLDGTYDIQIDLNNKSLYLNPDINFSNYKINNVILPKDLTNHHINLIRRPNTVFTDPDLLLEINDGSNIFFRTLELKSTKTNSIPGSSVQQINPFEWVLFIKHTKTDIYITTGLYIDSINNKLQFPDRSPRPQVSFKELEDFNKSQVQFTNDKLHIKLNELDYINKHKLINDWQTFLAEKWIDIVFSKSIKNNEPWFNNNLRKFIILFINKYENLTNIEKKAFKNNLLKLIK